MASAASRPAGPAARGRSASTASPSRFSISTWAMKQSWLCWPSPLRNSRASASVVERWVSLDRLSPLKSRSPLRPGEGGAPEPSFARKLFRLAHAWISVPSTEKCSSESNPAMRASSSTAAKNLLAISPPNSRSRFLVNTLTSHTFSSMPDEPAEQQIVIELFHQLPLRADGVERLQQQRSQQLLRRDRRPANRRIDRLKISVQVGERCINNRPDRPQQMRTRH